MGLSHPPDRFPVPDDRGELRRAGLVETCRVRPHCTASFRRQEMPQLSPQGAIRPSPQDTKSSCETETAPRIGQHCGSKSGRARKVSTKGMTRMRKIIKPCAYPAWGTNFESPRFL